MYQFSLDQITAFIAVVETGTFRKAAERLGKNRTTVHQLVTNLELDVGYSLLVKSKQKTELAEEATSFYLYARYLIRSADQLQHIASSLHTGEKRELRIGYDESLLPDTIGAIEQRIKEAGYSTFVHWLKVSRKAGLQALNEQELDFLYTMNGITLKTYPPEGMDFVSLGMLPFGAYANRHSELAGMPAVSHEYLSSCPQFIYGDLIGIEDGAPFRISQNLKMVSDLSLLVTLLSSDGWAMLPKHIAKKMGRDLVPLKLDFVGGDYSWGYSLYFSKDLRHGRQGQHIIEIFQTCFDQISRER